MYTGAVDIPAGLLPAIKARLVDTSLIRPEIVHLSRRLVCGEWWVERVFSEYLVLRNVRDKVRIVTVACLADYADSYNSADIAPDRMRELADKCTEALISVGALAAQDVSLEHNVES